MSNSIKLSSLKSLIVEEYMPYELNVSSVDIFLKIRETLTRVGRLQNSANGKESLWQVCHIVQDEDNQKYYLVHFKHLYIVGGKNDNTEFNDQDFNQMTYIASLLEKWNLVSLNESLGEVNTRCNISIIPFSRKKDVLLRKKYYVREDKQSA